MLREVLTKRKAVKREMGEIDLDTATADQQTLYNTLNARQLALKVLANSCYGAAGSPTGYMPMLPLAYSTTFQGRWMIEQTKRLILENGHFSPEIIYGDTGKFWIKLRYFTEI